MNLDSHVQFCIQINNALNPAEQAPRLPVINSQDHADIAGVPVIADSLGETRTYHGLQGQQAILKLLDLIDFLCTTPFGDAEGVDSARIAEAAFPGWTATKVNGEPLRRGSD
jgi:hypothetical protein